MNPLNLPPPGCRDYKYIYKKGCVKVPPRTKKAFTVWSSLDEGSFTNTSLKQSLVSETEAESEQKWEKTTVRAQHRSNGTEVTAEGTNAH